MNEPLRVADALLAELEAKPALREHSPSMTQVAKVSYTHDSMIDLIIERPTISQNELAAHFGYSVPWVSHIIASDAFQMRLAARKDELIDPTIRATIEERFKALVYRSLEVLHEKLNRPVAAIPDNLALRAAELGARSLGLGGATAAPAAPQGDRLLVISERLVNLLHVRKEEAINGEARVIHEEPELYKRGAALSEGHEHAKGEDGGNGQGSV